MTRQLRQSVWWPGMSNDIRDYTASCLGCASAVSKNYPPPMMTRPTPIGPWIDCSAVFKGPIAGQYYFHLLIDNYSRWPEVEIVKSTSFEELRPALDRSFSLLGIPLTITHDGGPPYQSKAWENYAKEMGFTIRRCTPEHPEANGIAERFMSVIVKTVHAAIAEGKSPKVEVRRRLMNYRNTPHPSTGKSPSELIMNRTIRTKIAAPIKPACGKIHKEAKQQDEQTRALRKLTYGHKKKALARSIHPGDKVLIKQQSTTTKPPYDPKPYVVTKVKGTQITAVRGEKVRVRNMAKCKLLVERPSHLSRKVHQHGSQRNESSDVDINLGTSQRRDMVDVEQEIIVEQSPSEVVTDQELVENRNTTILEPQNYRRFSSRTVKPPERFTGGR